VAYPPVGGSYANFAKSRAHWHMADRLPRSSTTPAERVEECHAIAKNDKNLRKFNGRRTQARPSEPRNTRKKTDDG
jgi:hypothetical protein